MFSFLFSFALPSESLSPSVNEEHRPLTVLRVDLYIAGLKVRAEMHSGKGKLNSQLLYLSKGSKDSAVR